MPPSAVAIPARWRKRWLCVGGRGWGGEARERGASAVAERHLRQAVAADPLRETAQRALMQALAAGGNYAAALLVYRELRLRLHREVNAEPHSETRALFEQLRAEARQAPHGPRAELQSPKASLANMVRRPL